MWVQHKSGCLLDPVHWLKHAITAAGYLAADSDQPISADRVAAEQLTDALAYLAEMPGWATVTLLDVVRLAAPTAEEYGAWMCTCGAT
jgi:hypothetical protein